MKRRFPEDTSLRRNLMAADGLEVVAPGYINPLSDILA